ncbi:hypothetical protein Y032_0626g820 [Ancylostoma ceylanicum]|uniref:Uncharacterized protein n=1 Tax=Ancylostoma ceylanicum TaxID=53326 RepID=A0A016WKJ9_9BILA|nr:hypothetical protein Y032_0626g820 [Ancylostoma ceylanicum]
MCVYVSLYTRTSQQKRRIPTPSCSARRVMYGKDRLLCLPQLECVENWGTNLETCPTVGRRCAGVQKRGNACRRVQRCDKGAPESKDGTSMSLSTEDLLANDHSEPAPSETCDGIDSCEKPASDCGPHPADRKVLGKNRKRLYEETSAKQCSHETINAIKSKLEQNISHDKFVIFEGNDRAGQEGGPDRTLQAPETACSRRCALP